MPNGHVIVLDGPSSAGKSTLSRSLQRILDAPYWHLSQDHFWQMLPQEGTAQRSALTAEGCLTVFHRTIASLSQNGNNVIVDTGFLEKSRLIELVQELASSTVLFVSVTCPIEELERREIQRGDRPVGYTRAQMHRHYQHGIFDLIVDTMRHTSLECAQIIKEAMQHPPAPSAFQQLLEKEL